MRCQTFPFSFFPCSADHERDWPPCKVVFFGLATNALNVRNNNNNNKREHLSSDVVSQGLISLSNNPSGYLKIFPTILYNMYVMVYDSCR